MLENVKFHTAVEINVTSCFFVYRRLVLSWGHENWLFRTYILITHNHCLFGGKVGDLSFFFSHGRFTLISVLLFTLSFDVNVLSTSIFGDRWSRATHKFGCVQSLYVDKSVSFLKTTFSRLSIPTLLYIIFVSKVNLLWTFHSTRKLLYWWKISHFETISFMDF